MLVNASAIPGNTIAAWNDIQVSAELHGRAPSQTAVMGGARTPGKLERAVFRSDFRGSRSAGGRTAATRLLFSRRGAVCVPVRPDLVGVERPHVFPFAVRLRRLAEQRPFRSTDLY